MKTYDLKAVDIAKAFNVSDMAVYKWVKSGCPHKKVRVGLRQIMHFNLEEVKKWIEERR